MSNIKYLSSKNMKYYSLAFYKKEKNFDLKIVQHSYYQFWRLLMFIIIIPNCL